MLIIFILSFFSVATINALSQEIEIPNDFQPIDGNSQILYSYKFVSMPKFMERINDTEFIIFDIHQNNAKICLYDSKTNRVELKSEFIVNELESLNDYRIDGDKLILLFKNYTGSIGNKNEGYYWRETIVDLNTFQPKSSKIIYTTIDINLFKIDEYNEDLNCAINDIDTNMFLLNTSETKKIEIEPSEYISFYDTYNQNDSSIKNYLSIVNEKYTQKLYARATFFEPDGISPKSFLVKLLDSTERIRMVDVHWTYLDDNSNLYFLFSWHDKHLSKRFLSFNRLAPNGELRYYHKEIDTELDLDDYYVIHDFETINKNGNKIKAMGIARLPGSEKIQLQSAPLQEERVIGIFVAKFDLESLEFTLQAKKISKKEGFQVNDGVDYLKFNIINKVIETNGGYVVLAEHIELDPMYYSIRPRSSILKYYSNYHYLSMNLFELDENLNFKWNNYIKDRNLYTIGGTWGQLKNSVSKFSNRVTLQPKIQDSTITFSYSSSKDTLIKRVEYNIKNGNLIEETPIFNNDQISSFCPGYQFPIGNNEFVTLLIEEDFYLVRYKLLK